MTNKKWIILLLLLGGASIIMPMALIASGLNVMAKVVSFAAIPLGFHALQEAEFRSVFPKA